MTPIDVTVASRRGVQVAHWADSDFEHALVSEAPGPDARAAIAALGTYRHDEALRSRVRDAAEGREDADLRGAVEEAFAD